MNFKALFLITSLSVGLVPLPSHINDHDHCKKPKKCHEARHFREFEDCQNCKSKKTCCPACGCCKQCPTTIKNYDKKYMLKRFLKATLKGSTFKKDSLKYEENRSCREIRKGSKFDLYLAYLFYFCLKQETIIYYLNYTETYYFRENYTINLDINSTKNKFKKRLSDLIAINNSKTTADFAQNRSKIFSQLTDKKNACILAISLTPKDTIDPTHNFTLKLELIINTRQQEYYTATYSNLYTPKRGGVTF
ncbi:hypothetical protein ACFLY6_00940 [Candidatus Dependentiae bacterium]